MQHVTGTEFDIPIGKFEMPPGIKITKPLKAKLYLDSRQGIMKEYHIGVNTELFDNILWITYDEREAKEDYERALELIQKGKYTVQFKGNFYLRLMG
jgi:hypothetical protein